MENYERYSEFVEDWKNARFPARPSPEEIELIDGLLEDAEGKQVLILGATPEYRDLSLKHQMKVTCADMNRDMLLGMKNLMTLQREEDLIMCDWLQMPFEDEQFDLIMAEQSINILPPEMFASFLVETKRVMNTNGFFIMKTLVYADESEEAVLQRWREQHRDITYLYNHFFNRAAFYKNHTASHAECAAAFRRLNNEGKISQEELQAFLSLYGALCDADLKLNGYPQESFEFLLRKHFIINQRVYGKDEEKHKRHPIYILTK